MHRPHFTAGRWKQHLWLSGLVLAPLLFGSVGGDGQAVVGICLGISMLISAGSIGVGARRIVPVPLVVIGLALLILPLVPFPIGWIGILSPETRNLVLSFPSDLGDPRALLPLSLSPAGTIQRLWELWLIVSVFQLARHSAGDERFARPLTYAIVTALALLAASDIHFRAGDGKTILGVWPIAWGNAAGTFANRNHFANWCVVGAVFASGWVLRSLQPLHFARSGASPSVRAHRREGQVIAVVVMFALGMAVLSGSRGAIAAFGTAMAVGLALFIRRKHRHDRWLVPGIVVLATLVLLMALGNVLLARLIEAPADLASGYPKLAIWRETWLLATHFPLFGTGVGTFVAAFGHYKSFGGDVTFIHAENEYLQLLAECGFLGAIVFLAILFFVLRSPLKAAWSRETPLPEPELFFAALAGVAAFAVHAGIEFVFQIPATAMLGAALVGFLVGSLDSIGRPQVLPPLPGAKHLLNVAWGCGLILTAVLVGGSALDWREALKAKKRGDTTSALSHGEISLQLWPWNSAHQLLDARQRVSALLGQPKFAQQAAAKDIRTRLQAAIQADPFNWELRYQRAWLDMAFSTNAPLALAEAGEVMRLNPLQSQIPIGFARFFASRNPDRAWEFLADTGLEKPETLREALAVAWSLPGDRARLWSLVPTDTQSINTFGDVAREKGEFTLAVQAYRQLAGRVPDVELAEKYLLVQRPDLALAQLPVAPNGIRGNLVAARSALALGRFDQAVHFAEMVWSATEKTAAINRPYPVASTSTELAMNWKKGATQLSPARQLAEAIYNQPPDQRDVELLKDVSAQHAAELRIKWILYRAAWEKGDKRLGARIAVELAERAAGSAQ